MKKAISLFLSAILILPLLEGCGNNDTVAGENEKVKIEFFHYKAEAKNVFDQIIHKFEDEHPNIDVVQTNPPVAETVLRTRIFKRNVPDIIGIGANNNFAEFSKSGIFLDLSDNESLQEIKPAYVKMIQDLTGLQEVHAIPYAANASAVIYNKAIFRELGLEVPTTWDQFIEVAEKVKAAGQIPFYLTYKDAWTGLPSFNALVADTNGENFFKNLGEGKIQVDKEFNEAAEKFTILSQNGHKDQFGKGYADGNMAFANGKSAMYLQGIWAIPEIKKANPDIELGVFPYPVTNDPAKNKVVSGIDLLLSISKTTKHPKEAKEFIKFLLDDENVRAYISEQNSFSAKDGINQDDPILQGLKASFEKGAIVDFPDHYFPIGVPVDKYLQELSYKKDVKRFLNHVDQEWKKAQDRK